MEIASSAHASTSVNNVGGQNIDARGQSSSNSSGGTSSGFGKLGGNSSLNAHQVLTHQGHAQISGNIRNYSSEDANKHLTNDVGNISHGVAKNSSTSRSQSQVVKKKV